MSKIKSVAVMYGSDSSEWEVSCRSGEFTASRIDEFKYDVYEIFARHGEWSLVAMRKANSMRIPFPEGARPQIDKNDFSVNVLGEKVKFDYVYIMQHGAPGETGLLQGYFEMLGIPFSSCSAFVTTVAFNKFTCKNYLRDLDFVKYVMAIDPAKKLNTYGKGKYLLRKAFEQGDYLPHDILYREKAAFSDAVGHSLVNYLKAYAEDYYSDEDFYRLSEKYTHAKPFTKESLLYREIFERYYPGQSKMIVDFWMPNKSWDGCNVNDPSARVLSNYGASAC